MESIWKDTAFNLPIRKVIKQLAAKLRMVKEREGQCIKMSYGEYLLSELYQKQFQVFDTVSCNF